MRVIKRDCEGKIVVRKRPLFFDKTLMLKRRTGDVMILDCFTTDSILR